MHQGTEWLLWVSDGSDIFFSSSFTTVVSGQWWVARYMLGIVLTTIHMISSTVSCPLVALDKSLSLSAPMLLLKKTVCFSAILGCAFETHCILELTLLRTTVHQSGEGKQGCTKHFCCLVYCHLLPGSLIHSLNLSLWCIINYWTWTPWALLINTSLKITISPVVCGQHALKLPESEG